jgi:hypothetical protein
MLISYIKRGLSMVASHYVAKPLFIAFLSILIAYYLPDLTAGIIERGMPDFPGIEQTPKIDFYEYVQLFSMMLILVFSCWTSFYGIYGLIRYTMFQKHQGKKKLILVIVTYMYMIIGFANTYFLVSYVGDGGDALYKFQNYYKLSQNKETKELMIQKELRVSNSNALFGIKDKLWSGVDTKEQLKLWNSELFNEISEPLPVDFIFKGIEYPEPKIVRYLPDNKISVYTDCLYFSTITIASVGYGDIIPQSGLAKFLVCLETIMGQLLLALGIASAYSGISNTSKNNRMAN